MGREFNGDTPGRPQAVSGQMYQAEHEKGLAVDATAVYGAVRNIIGIQYFI
jgi:hypothetical protein